MTLLRLAMASPIVALISAPPSSAQAPERRWLPEPVLVASFVDENGTLFGDPQEIVALPHGAFALADRGENTIRAFLADGSPAWTFGRSGAGPGEFGSIQDIDVSPAGEVLVLDRRLGRATILDAATGKQVTGFSILTGGQYGILPSSGPGRVLVIPEGEKDKTLWVAVSEDGAALESADMPVACAHGLACEAYSATTGSMGAALAFRWSSKVIFLDPGGSVRFTIDGVEGLPVPDVNTESTTIPGLGNATVTRVDRSAGTATAGLTGDELNLYVLFGGSEEEERRRIVNVYSVATGDYRGSFLFPNSLAGLAILSDGRLATLDRDYIPTVHIWELSW
ncbi:MAG: hypothetical protein F4087_00425 [Gemmatimonadetes bacterium]|nr:hypothetical protein [Gemmatimonadota bacterium]MYE70572.1 hypothetical protein [Gemmatimonadota bacterium]MYJ66962.1 hypothetical protein [Gemmatimonadota bacterium]